MVSVSFLSLKIGEFFLKSRLKNNLSLESVAQDLEIDCSVLAAYEDGTTKLPLEDIFALTNFYNIAPDCIVAMFYELAFSLDREAGEAR